MRIRKRVWLYLTGAMGIALLAVVCFFAIQHVKETQDTFAQDGYVLKEAERQPDATLRTTPLYFKAGETYSQKYPNAVAFNDVQSNSVSIDKNSFIHYANGSLSALTSGVLLNLGDIEDESMIRCYGLKAGTVMARSGSQYSLDHMGTPITFSSFIWKVDSSKYMIVGDQFTLNISNQDPVEITEYLEIEYVDDSVVKIYNNNMLITTISSDCVLEMNDDVMIDLSARNVLYNGQAKLDFAQMVVDSNDNIEVTPLDDDDKGGVIPKFVAINGQNGKDGTGGEGGKAGEAGGAGAIGDAVNAGDKEVLGEPEESVILPLFEVEIDQDNMTASTVTGSVRITDEESRLVPGTVALKIMNNATGEMVYGPELYDGFIFDFKASGLTENTQYRLIFEAEYLVNNEKYSKIFYDGVFIADALGLSFDIDKAATAQLSFKIKRESFSPVSSAILALYDAAGLMIDQKPLSFLSDSETVTFNTGLSPNTSYSAQLVQVGGSYANGDPVQFDKYGTPLGCKTLKRTPTVGQPNVTVNKRSGAFEVQISSLVDQDNGVEKIRYEIYQLGGTVPVTSAYGNGTNRVDFAVKGLLQRNIPYTVKAVAEFNDNEKNVDIESNMSGSFIMEGADFPTLRFEPTTIAFERITGVLYIESSGATVKTSEPITVFWQDSIGNVYQKNLAATVVSGNTLSINFDEGGLRQKETYSIWVTASVDMNDSNPVDEVMIGPVKVQTIEADAFSVTMSKTSPENADPAKAISIDVQLQGADGIDAAYEASTLGFLKFNLYEGSTLDPGKLLRSISVSDTGGASYASLLKGQYYDDVVTLTESDFGLTSASLKSSTYLLEVESAHDYTNHDSNFFVLKNNTYAFLKTSTPPSDPPVSERNDALQITPITLGNIGNYQVDMNSWLGADKTSAIKNDTILGYEVKPRFDNSGKYARLITYQMYKLGSYQETPTMDNATASGSKANTLTPSGIQVPVEEAQDYLPSLVVLFGSKGGAQDGFVGTDKTRYYYFTGYEQQSAAGFGRGAQYFFSYTARLNTLDATASNNLDYPSDPSDPDLFLFSQAAGAPKQVPDFKFYPASSTTSAATWRYQYSDFDAVLSPATLYCKQLNDTVLGSQTISTTTSNYGTVTFTGLTSFPAYEISVNQNLYPAYSGLTAKRTLFSRTHQTDDVTNMYYTVYVPEDNMNRLYVVLGTNQEQMGIISDTVYRRIAGAEITVQGQAIAGGTISRTFNLGVTRASIQAGTRTCIEVPYSLLAEFAQGVPLEFASRVLYDTGSSGFESSGYSGYYAVQFPSSGASPAAGNYYVIRSIGTGLTESINASGSWFKTVSHSAATQTITYAGNMMAADQNAGGTFNLTYREDGPHMTIAGVSRLVTLKALKGVTGVLSTGGTNIVNKPLAVPEVTINLNEDVSIGLNNISGEFAVTGLDIVKEDHFYIEFFTENMTPLPALTLSLAKGADGIYQFSLPGGLTPNTVYYFRISGVIQNASTTRVSFYDTAAKRPKDYQFKTLDEVQIQNVEVTYEPVSYADKNLYANFTLDTTLGFNLMYDFVRDDGEVLTHEQMSASSTVGSAYNARSMRVPFIIDPETAGGNWFEFGRDYTVYITAFSGAAPTWTERRTYTAGSSGALLLGQSVTPFELRALNEPLMGLSATAGTATNGTDMLSIRVVPGDWDRTIVDDMYYFRVFDSSGVDRTPSAQVAVKLATGSAQTIEVSNLAQGAEYTVRCYAVTDMQNGGALSNITEVASPIDAQYMIAEIKASTLDSSGVSVGTVSPRKSPRGNNYVQLVFTNSVNLTDLTELRYSIYKGGTVVESLKKINLTSSLVYDAASNYYYVDLETVLPGTGNYTVQVQYYKGNLKVGADASYTYINS